jgi:hypothetical protein
MGSVVGFVIQMVLVAASVAYQMKQAKKAKKKAKEAADARKGYEIPIEGEPSNLPLVYGRAKVGGVRVFHKSRNKFKYTESNADKVLQAGPRQRQSGTFTTFEWDYDNAEYDSLGVRRPTIKTVEHTYSGSDGGLLSRNLDGKRHEFLFVQQALCQGPIHNCYDVVIDESRSLKDDDIGTYEDNFRHPKAAFRIDVHNNGGTADAIAGVNFSERQKATFDDMAYASMVVRLDRDDPQFNSVPDVQFLIEGKLVRTVVGGVLSTEFAYSNNPAWCLLDYLMDNISGKGIPVSEIDLASFEAAAAVCDTIVQQDAAVGGWFYQPFDETRYITQRDIPLYECNLIVDTTKPIRENVEAILATMGDARLVWSGGKYKLSLQYPSSNDVIENVIEITDDDLCLEQDIEISWPSASDRLNFCTIKYHNECEEFKEDSVSWPPKYNKTYFEGVGGSYYRLQTGSWGDTALGQFKESFGVWDGTDDATLSYQFVVRKENTGTCKLEYGGDIVSVTITDVAAQEEVTQNNVTDYTSAPSSADVNLGDVVADKVYQIDIVIHNTSTDPEKKCAAAAISQGGMYLWTTREPNYDSFIVKNLDDTVYSEMLEEDSYIEMETEIFAEGITDYYHALAKAEETVRTSRSAFTIKFKYVLRDKYLEPGDFIKLVSSRVGIGSPENPLYIKVNSVKVDEDKTCEVNGERFDYTQLAWNIVDDEYIRPRSLYQSFISRPQNLVYSTDSINIYNSSGKLTWDPVSDETIAGYIVYAHLAGDPRETDTNLPLFTEIGRTTEPFFILPALEAPSAIFAVQAYSDSGAKSKMQYTSETTATLLPNFWDRSLTLIVDTNQFKEVTPGNITPETITINAISNDFVSPEITWYVDGVLQEGENGTSLVLNSFTDTTSKTIKVQYIENTIAYSAAVDIFYSSIPYMNVGVENLKVQNSTGDGVTFVDHDCIIEWDAPTGIWENLDWLKHYLIEVYAKDAEKIPANVLYSETTGKNTVFEFTFAKNLGITGGPLREFDVLVHSVDTDGDVGSPTQISPVNNQAAQVVGLGANVSFGTAELYWTPVDEVALKGYEIHVSQTSDFIPSTETLHAIVGNNSNSLPINLTSDGTYYFKVGAYDAFGNGNVSYSSAFEFTIDTSSSTTNAIDFAEGFSKAYTVPVLEGDSFSVDAGTLSWNEHSVWYQGIEYIIAAGSTTDAYVYWSKDTNPNNYLHVNDKETFKGILDPVNHVWQIATNLGTSFEIAWNAQANAAIGTAVLGKAVVENENIGNLIQSNNFNLVIGESCTGWRITKDGKIIGTDIEIYAPDGTLLIDGAFNLDASSPVWSNIQDDGNKPDDNADVTSENISADTAAVAGVAAATLVADTTEIITRVDQMADDGVITSFDKAKLRAQWETVTKEYNDVINYAILNGVTAVESVYQDFNLAYLKLQSYLISIGVWSEPDVAFVLTDDTFETLTDNYTQSLQDILNAAAEEIGAEIQEAREVYAEAQALLAETTAKAYADGIVTTAEQTAIDTAQAYSDAADTALQVTLEAYSDGVADAAETAAIASANAYADLKKTEAQAYADGAASDAEQAAIVAAQAYSDLKKTEALAYADGIVSTAEQAAIDAAQAYSDLKKTEALAYADGIVDAEETRAIADAQAKADAAEAAAKAYVDANFVDAVTYDADLAAIQAQIDGNITSWFLTGIPTLSNAPAVDWTTEALKIAHLGDLYYDGDTGYCYRFTFDDPNYVWVLVTDSDITEAISLASNALDVADSKRRVFVATPTVPYDIGDLWDTGTDIKRCYTAKTSQQSYSADDWTSVQTADATTKANAALASAEALIDDVETIANTATLNVASAMNSIAELSDDNTLSPLDKATLRSQWSQFESEYFGLLYYASVNGIDTTETVYTDLELSKTALENYLIAAGGWSDPDNSFETDNTLSTLSSNYYNAVETLTAEVSGAISAVIQDAAEEYSEAKAMLAETTSNAYADGIVTAAEQNAIDTAQAYADAADVVLQTAIEAYADGVADDAETAAIASAQAYADARKTEALAYADGIVSDEEIRAIADAQAKADAAEAAAKAASDPVGSAAAALASAQSMIDTLSGTVDGVAADATQALSLFDDMIADDTLTAADKATIRSQWDQLESEHSSLLSYATLNGVDTSETIYFDVVNSKDQFESYLVAIGVWSDTETSVDISDGLLVDFAETYYAALETLVAEVSASISAVLETAIQDYSDAKAMLAETTAKAYADGIVTESEQTAIDTAQAYTDAANVALQTTVEAYADGVADDAELAAIAAAEAYADARKVEAQAYADGVADAAELAATAAANAYADLKKTEANAYADGIVSDEEARAIADAQAKADAAEAAAKNYTEGWCEQGADITGDNVAASIVNQGAFATVDEINESNFATYVKYLNADAITVGTLGTDVRSETGTPGTYSLLTQGDLVFYKNYEAYKYLKQILTGQATSNNEVTLQNFDRIPKVLVSLSSLRAYDANYANQNQRWEVYHEGVIDNGDGTYSFTPKCMLTLDSGAATTPLSDYYQGASNYTTNVNTTPANTTKISINGSINSIRGTGTVPDYYYRKATVTLYYRPNGSSDPYDSVSTVVANGDDLTADTLFIETGTLTSDTYDYYLGIVWADMGGTFEAGGTSYEEGPTVERSNLSLFAEAYANAYSSSTTQVNDSDEEFMTLAAYTPTSPYEIYRVVYDFELAWKLYCFHYRSTAKVSLPTGTQLDYLSCLSASDPDVNESYNDDASSYPDYRSHSFETTNYLTSIGYKAEASATFSNVSGQAKIRARNLHATIYTRKLASNNSTAVNTVNLANASFVLSSAQVLDNAGVVNWIAIA